MTPIAAPAIASALNRQTYLKKRLSLGCTSVSTWPTARLVDLGRTLQRLFELLEREVRAARDLQDRRFAPAAEFGGFRNLRRDIGRDHDGAVLVGMDEIIGMHRHAGNAHFAAPVFGVNPGVRRPDRTGQCLKARRPLRDIADRTVGDDAETAERLVHVALHLAPERAVAYIGAVDILDHGDARTEAGADIFVIGDAALALLIGWK